MKFIVALNSIGPIPAAFFLILIGGSFMLIFKAMGLSPEDVKTGHDIVIAGISFISGIAVAAKSQGNGDHSQFSQTSSPPLAAPAEPAQPK